MFIQVIGRETCWMFNGSWHCWRMRRSACVAGPGTGSCVGAGCVDAVTSTSVGRPICFVGGQESDGGASYVAATHVGRAVTGTAYGEVTASDGEATVSADDGPGRIGVSARRGGPEPAASEPART